MTGIEIAFIVIGVTIITIVIIGYMTSSAASNGYVVTVPKRDYDGDLRGIFPRYSQI